MFEVIQPEIHGDLKQVFEFRRARPRIAPVAALIALVDKEAAPLLWAEIHEPLVVFLLEHAKLDRADDSQKDMTTRKIHDSSRTRALTSRL